MTETRDVTSRITNKIIDKRLTFTIVNDAQRAVDLQRQQIEQDRANAVRRFPGPALRPDTAGATLNRLRKNPLPEPVSI
jgi:hypothetical protein